MALLKRQVSLSFFFWSLRHAHRSHWWPVNRRWRSIRHRSLSPLGCAFWGSRWYGSPLRVRSS